MKRVIFIVSAVMPVLFVMLSGLIHAQDTREIDGLIDRGRYKEALELCEKIDNSFTRSIKLQNMLDKAVENNKMDDAKLVIDRYLEEKNPSSSALRKYLKGLAVSGKYEEAEEYAQKDDNKYTVGGNLETIMETMIAKGDIDNAITFAAKYIDHDGFTSAHQKIIQAILDEKKSDKAFEFVKQIKDESRRQSGMKIIFEELCKSDSPEVLDTIPFMMMRFGARNQVKEFAEKLAEKQSEQTLRKYLDSLPNDIFKITAEIEFVKSQLKGDRKENALKTLPELEKRIEKLPLNLDKSEMICELAVAYEKSGQPEKAEKTIDGALKIADSVEPHMVDFAYVNIVFALSQMHRFDKAEEAIDKIKNPPQRNNASSYLENHRSMYESSVSREGGEKRTNILIAAVQRAAKRPTDREKLDAFLNVLKPLNEKEGFKAAIDASEQIEDLELRAKYLIIAGTVLSMPYEQRNPSRMMIRNPLRTAEDTSGKDAAKTTIPSLQKTIEQIESTETRAELYTQCIEMMRHLGMEEEEISPVVKKGLENANKIKDIKPKIFALCYFGNQLYQGGDAVKVREVFKTAFQLGRSVQDSKDRDFAYFAITCACADMRMFKEGISVADMITDPQLVSMANLSLAIGMNQRGEPEDRANLKIAMQKARNAIEKIRKTDDQDFCYIAVAIVQTLCKQNTDAEKSVEGINDRNIRSFAADLIKATKMAINEDFSPEFARLVNRMANNPYVNRTVLPSHIAETDNVFAIRVIHVQHYYIRPYGFGYRHLSPPLVRR